MRDRKKIPLFIVFFLALLVSSATAKDVFKNSYFELEFGTTGITSLKAVNDDFKTNFIREGAALGDVRIRFRMEDAEWQETIGDLSFLNKCPLFEPAQTERNFTSAALVDADESGIFLFSSQKRPPSANLILTPKFTPGDEITYGFSFRWADRDQIY